MTLQEALDLFLQVNRSPATTETYRQFLAGFVAAIGPLRPVELVRPEDIDAYVQAMRARKDKFVAHPTRPVVRRPLSPATVYKNVKMIKTFFNWCERRGLATPSPARFIVNRRPTSPLGQGKAATDDEVETLLLASRFDPRDRAMILLLARSGCRAGELASLTIQDLDLRANAAFVNGKGDKRRRIYFDAETSEAIGRWLERRPEADHDCVFLGKYDRQPLTSSAVSQVIRRLCRKAEIRSLGAHSLRHRVGLSFARARVAPRVAQHYLGHTNLLITLGYYQDVDESDLIAAGELLK